ncbi:MAG: heavy metal-associated domain-containing protein [Methanoregula sp.]|jgi:Cu+-exporting ATPase
MTDRELGKTGPDRQGTAATKEVVIKIGGMMCAHCVKRTETVIGKLPGVTRATVSLEKKEACVVFDPSLSSPDDMRKAIENAGYKYLGHSGEA